MDFHALIFLLWLMKTLSCLLLVKKNLAANALYRNAKNHFLTMGAWFYIRFVL